jgi:acetoin utilization protein AcuC
VAIAEQARADAAALAGVLADLGATLPEFAPFLASEGLVTWDGEVAALTDAGAEFLADPSASLGGPTFARPQVERAARRVCGAVLDAVDRITRGEIPVAFVPIAGFHHARRDEARMYCLYNDPALALVAALDAVDGVVAYVDVDIHAGDGVHEAFADDPRVVIADLHGSADVSAGSIREVPLGDHHRIRALGPGHDDDAYLLAWEPLEAHLRACRPAFVVFEAGVDGLATDPMSAQRLTPAVFREVARRVKSIADAYAGGRLLVLGGGGYELAGMAAGWAAVVEGLLDDGT